MPYIEMIVVPGYEGQLKALPATILPNKEKYGPSEIPMRIGLILDQAIAVNYLACAYDQWLPPVLEEYRNELLGWIRKASGETISLRSTYPIPLDTVLATAEALITKNSLNGQTVANIKSWCQNLLPESKLRPSVTRDMAFLTAWLSFKLPEKIEKLSTSYRESLKTITVPGPIPIYLPHYAGRTMRLDPSVTFREWSSTPSYVKGMDTCPIYAKSFLHFLEGYDLITRDVLSVLGLLTNFALDLDCPATGSLGCLYSRIYRVLYSFSGGSDLQDPNSRSSSILQYADDMRTKASYERLFVFLDRLTEMYDITAYEGDMLRRLLCPSLTPEENAKLLDYFAAQTAATISLESYNAFKASPLRRLPQLNRLATEAVGEGTTTDAQDKGATPDKEPTTPSTEPASPTDDSHTSSTGMFNPSLKLNEMETVDSFLQRREILGLINAVLSDPQSGKLGSPKLNLLRSVRTYWLNVLSIDSLKVLVGRALTLPKTPVTLTQV